MLDDFLFVLKTLYSYDEALDIACDLLKKSPEQSSIDAYQAAIGEVCRLYDPK
jgi:hypothetical protein